MQHAVAITFAVITIAGIIALLHLLYCMRKHIKEQQGAKHRKAVKMELNRLYSKRAQAPSNLPVLHNYGNPCARGCVVCN